MDTRVLFREYKPVFGKVHIEASDDFITGDSNCTFSEIPVGGWIYLDGVGSFKKVDNALNSDTLMFVDYTFDKKKTGLEYWQDFTFYKLSQSALNLRAESENSGEVGVIVFDDITLTFYYSPLLNGVVNPVYNDIDLLSLNEKSRLLIRINRVSENEEVTRYNGVIDISTIQFPLVKFPDGSDYVTSISFMVKDKLSAFSLIRPLSDRRKEVNYIPASTFTQADTLVNKATVLWYNDNTDTHSNTIIYGYDPDPKNNVYCVDFRTLGLRRGDTLVVEDIDGTREIATVNSVIDSKRIQIEGAPFQIGNKYANQSSFANTPFSTKTGDWIVPVITWSINSDIITVKPGNCDLTTLVISSGDTIVINDGVKDVVAVIDYVISATTMRVKTPFKVANESNKDGWCVMYLRHYFTSIQPGKLYKRAYSNKVSYGAEIIADKKPDGKTPNGNTGMITIRVVETDSDSVLRNGYISNLPGAKYYLNENIIPKGSILAIEPDVLDDKGVESNSDNLIERPLFLVTNSILVNGSIWVDVVWNEHGLVDTDYTYNDGRGYNPKRFDLCTLPAFEETYYGIDIYIYDRTGKIIAIDGYKILRVLVESVWAEMTITVYGEDGNIVADPTEKMKLPLSYFSRLIEEKPFDKDPLDVLKYLSLSMNSYYYTDEKGNLIIRNREGINKNKVPKTLNYSKMKYGKKSYFWDKVVDCVKVSVESWIKYYDENGEWDGTYYDGGSTVSNYAGIDPRNPLEIRLVAQESDLFRVYRENPKGAEGDDSYPWAYDTRILNLLADEKGQLYFNFYGKRHTSIELKFSLDDEMDSLLLFDIITDHGEDYFIPRLTIDYEGNEISMTIVTLIGEEFSFDKVTVGAKNNYVSGGGSLGSSSGASGSGNLAAMLNNGTNSTKFIIGKNGGSGRFVLQLGTNEDQTIESDGESIYIKKLNVDEIFSKDVQLQNTRGMPGDVIFSSTGVIKKLLI